MSRTDYTKRMKIPLTGDPCLRLFTSAGTFIARGYQRVVIGGRGPYVEFALEQIQRNAIHRPEPQTWKAFVEWRSNDDSRSRKPYDANSGVMLFEQRLVMDYADYKIGMWYASPFDLRDGDGNDIIAPLEKKGGE